LIEYGREWKANLFGFLDRCGFEFFINVEINSRGHTYIILTRGFLSNDGLNERAILADRTTATDSAGSASDAG
jgi:hypothetical protein